MLLHLLLSFVGAAMGVITDAALPSPGPKPLRGPTPLALPASTTITTTLTHATTTVIPSTTLTITGTGPDPGYRNTTTTTYATTTSVNIPIYTFMPVPSPTTTFTGDGTAACTPTSVLHTLNNHMSYDCHCACGGPAASATATDVLWWGTDYAHQLTTSWCTYQPSAATTGRRGTGLPTAAPESFTSVFTGCAVAMPTAVPRCHEPTRHNGTAMDVTYAEVVDKAHDACFGSQAYTSGNHSFPLQGDPGGVVLRNGEYYYHNAAPEDNGRDIWLNYSLGWSASAECVDVAEQVAPGGSWCVGIFNQTYRACSSLDSTIQMGCLNWTLVEGFP